jgi:hypothetical protein
VALCVFSVPLHYVAVPTKASSCAKEITPFTLLKILGSTILAFSYNSQRFNYNRSIGFDLFKMPLIPDLL